jgi:hypothetical protein
MALDTVNTALWAWRRPNVLVQVAPTDAHDCGGAPLAHAGLLTLRGGVLAMCSMSVNDLLVLSERETSRRKTWLVVGGGLWVAVRCLGAGDLDFFVYLLENFLASEVDPERRNVTLQFGVSRRYAMSKLRFRGGGKETCRDRPLAPLR